MSITSVATVEDRLEKLEDEASIRELVARFADAATRHDVEMLASVFKKDAVFTIGNPLLNVAYGVDKIVSLISKLREDKEFFVQFVHSGQVIINGDRATAQWMIEEVAKGGDKYYHNYCVCSDAIEKIDGKWLLAERAFHFMYLDFSPFSGSAYSLPNPLATH